MTGPPPRHPEGAGNPLVVAIVLVYDRWDRLPRCLDALSASSYPNLRVLVVDNGSAIPPPLEVVARMAGLELIRISRNLGYAGGNNVGIRRARELGAEHVLIVNDDAYVSPDTVGGLVAAMAADPSVGAVGPLVLYARRPGVIQSAGGLWDRRRLWNAHRGEGEPDRGQYRGILDADYVDGCCVLLRVSALDTAGLLDEGFFLYFEELELCHRLRDRRFRCVVVPSVRVEHEGGGVPAPRSAVSAYFSHRNRLRFLRMTSRGMARVAKTLRAVAMEAPAIRDLVRNPGDPWVRARVRGDLDGLRGVSGAGPAWIFGAPTPQAEAPRPPRAPGPPSP